MYINGRDLLDLKPIRDMVSEKKEFNGTSFGLSELGYDVRINQDVLLMPFRRFRLASTMEYFQMPPNVGGEVKDKSTWIRTGILLGNTVLEPGWKGYLTLEVFYFGWRPIILRKGTGIAQILFQEAKNPNLYSGKYQHQENRPVAAKFQGLRRNHPYPQMRDWLNLARGLL